MRNRFELYEKNEERSNNWLRLHGYAMVRFCGKRKRMSHSERVNLPFPVFKGKGKENKRNK